MTENEEAAYLRGRQSILRDQLGRILGELEGDLVMERLAFERLETVATLRRICRDHGDNDWPDKLYLPDIIEKHLIGYYLDRLAEIEKLKWKLRQVEEERNAARTENERLNAQLREWQEERDTKAGYM